MNCKASASESPTFEKTILLQRFLFICISFLLSQVSNGQLSSQFSFYHFTMSDGLASNEVYSVVQDKTGYLWIATNNGLQRYDGVQYKTFQHQKNNLQSLPSNVLLKVMEYSADELWVLTNTEGIGLFNKNTFTYTNIPAITKIPGIISSAEKRLITDESGNTFLLLRGSEILKFDPVKKIFASISGFIKVLPGWSFTSISQQPGTEKYWFGLETGGLVIYNRATGNLSYTGHNVENEPIIEQAGPKSDFAYSFFDRQGRVWFHQWGTGFPYCMMFDTRSKNPILKKYELITTLNSYHEFRGLLQESNGRIWLHGQKVLAYFNEAEQKFEVIPNDFRNEQGIGYEGVPDIYEDREKNIWVSTSNNGLYRFNPSQNYFTNVAHTTRDKKIIGNGGLMSFIETKNGDLLTGTWEDGPFRYTKNLKNIPLRFKYSAKVGVPYFWSMYPSHDGNSIWMGAQPGVYLYNQVDNSVWFRNPTQLNGHTVRQIVEDKSGNLWLGMHGSGIFHWIDPRNRNKDSIIKIDEAKNAMVNQMLLDKKGLLWVATANYGLFTFDPTTGSIVKRWDDNKNLPVNPLMSLLEYSDSVLLIGSVTDLYSYNYNTKNIRMLRLPQTFIGNISSMQKDDEGFIWVATTNALYRIQPQLRSMVLFNRKDGIGNDRFEVAASYKMKDGRLLFGNSTSFIVFNPKEIRLSSSNPQIIITGIQVGDKDLRIDSVGALDQLTLGHKENSVIISFSSLTYSVNVPIQYKMVGIDDDWKTADPDNKASFPFLPPGHYTLLLRSVNAEGIPDSKQTILRIRIQSPWYQTWWFYTLVAIGFVAELWWLDRQRMLRKRSMQKVRTDISDNLHKEVNEALNNINILSEIARLKSEKEPQRAKEYLEQIHAKSHNMIIAMDDMLWSLDPQNDSMRKTINRIKEYTDAIMQRYMVNIELLIDKNVERLELNMKLRHEAFLLFKEGLRSLVEAGTSLCIVHVGMEKAKLLFTIEFENEGCDMQKLNNLLHRRDMEARLHALGAKLDVQVHKSRSVFLLQLPLG